MKKILAVEDSKVAQAQVLDILSGEYEVTLHEDGATAKSVALEVTPDLILLDVNLPGMNGYEICGQLKADVATREIPVIFLTSCDTSSEKVKGFEAGADDYIVKPFYPEELVARVSLHLASRREKQMAVEFERLKLLREMAVAISHEFNNPLTAILWHLHLATKELGEGNDKARTHLSDLKLELDKIRRIVARLAEASRDAKTEYVMGEAMIDVNSI
ncbi:response regulator transcription factor [Geomonas anaerohicana]|uniref:histidine kinase n=1 Tax=Geomonas anaerohicana TaxID=2798583 RepID=A0ABS0YAM8_9BACT|nr:response regulator [Geomonas anaerohicana]MBJ6748999.1 response regulator [Geomonas anaerohicana]